MLRLIIVAIVSTFLLIPVAGFSSNIIGNEVLLVVISCFIGYVIVPIILLRLWPAKPATLTLDTLQQAIEKGHITTIEYAISEVVEIEEYEDEGLHYLLSISSEKTLSLRGHYLYPYSELPNFPATIMRLFVHTENNLCYGIECVGSNLGSVRKVTQASNAAVDAEVVPSDMEVIEKPISDVVSEIQKYA
ncbi:hypothetical protein [Pseudoalteromonas sp. PPB1]|uniref:hypothetical protein n=1 Tax=Pseudoalteromonas sp. PPB1 TaxID=2756136 RepID=UPI001890F8EB|nr:hypothetical protein [Pseudoalteromonas sp. PPB1]